MLYVGGGAEHELQLQPGQGGMDNPGGCLHRAFRAFLPTAPRPSEPGLSTPHLPTHQKFPISFAHSDILTLGPKSGLDQKAPDLPDPTLSSSVPTRVRFPETIRGGGLGPEKTSWKVLQCQKQHHSLLREGGKPLPRQGFLVDLTPALCTLLAILDKGWTGALLSLSVDRSLFCTDDRSLMFSDFSPTLAWYLSSLVPGRHRHDGALGLYGVFLLTRPK